MTWGVILSLSSLMVAMVVSAAVRVTWEVRAVARYEQRVREELAARSAVEYAVMLLQGDRQRGWDTLDEPWAQAQLPDTGGFSGVWPRGASFSIEDLERWPPAVGKGPRPGPQWLNVCTAPVSSWRALGISERGAAALVERVREGIRTPDELCAVLRDGPDEEVLRTLLASGVLGTRSEWFAVHYAHPRSGGEVSCHRVVVHREASTGRVRLEGWEEGRCRG